MKKRKGKNVRDGKKWKEKRNILDGPSSDTRPEPAPDVGAELLPGGAMQCTLNGACGCGESRK
jgi:hypothetical protein